MSEDKECRGLLPCPFCGSNNARAFNSPDEYGRDSFGIQCQGTDCCISGPERGSEVEAVAAWNRRAAKPAVPEVLFDGYAVLQAMSEKAKARTSPANVSDVLDAAVKLIRAAAPPLPVAQGVPVAKFLDEIEAVRAGDEFLNRFTANTGGRVFYVPDDGTGPAPRIKWVAFFDIGDNLRAVYLLTRDQFNRTQLTLVDAAPTPPETAKEPT